ncbi:MAG: hypothetical protein WBJ83_02785 [Thermacetogeniaceae bacterium]
MSQSFRHLDSVIRPITQAVPGDRARRVRGDCPPDRSSIGRDKSKKASLAPWLGQA